jgi:hypothetical protein
MKDDEMDCSQKVQTVWELEVIFCQKTVDVKFVDIRSIKVAPKFFKKETYKTSKGIARMKKTRKEILDLLVGAIKAKRGVQDVLKPYHEEILRDYPELLV